MNIQIEGGYEIILDDEDFSRVEKYQWEVQKSGDYIRVCMVDRRGTTLHRFILGSKAGKVIDHINGNGLDNRKENLRFCTQGQNMMNKKKSKGSPMPFKGIFWKETRKVFIARITVNGKQIELGSFTCPFKAARAYDAAAKIHYKEFANLNFPNEKP